MKTKQIVGRLFKGLGRRGALKRHMPLAVMLIAVLAAVMANYAFSAETIYDRVSAGEYVDVGLDTSKGISMNLVEKGLTHKVLEFEITSEISAQDIQLLIAENNFDANEGSLSKFSIASREQPVYETSCTPYRIADEVNGSEMEISNCTTLQTGTRTVEYEEWAPVELKSNEKNADASLATFNILEKGRYRYSFDTPIVQNGNGWGNAGTVFLKVGNDLLADKQHSSWWNTSYSYKSKISSKSTDYSAFSVNDTAGVQGTQLWAYTGNESYVYSTGQFKSGTISISNETTEKFWENATDVSGNNPYNVWQSGTSAVFHFDETSGSVANKSTRYGFNGTLKNMNTTAWYKGVHGNALYFTGNDYVNVGGFAELPTGNNNWAMEAWIKPMAQMSGAGIIGLGVAATKQMIYFAVNGVNYDFLVQFGAHDFDTTFEAIPNQWQHVALSYDGSLVKFYHNGLLKSTIDPDPLEINPVNFKIGSHTDGTGGYFEGLIDEVRVYNTSISASDILNHYYNGINNFSSLGAEQIWTVNTSEADARTAIAEGIQNKLPSAAIYTDQQIYVRYLNNTQLLRTFDKVAAYGNQRWAFNYVTGSESYTYLPNLAPSLYVWENASLYSGDINVQVSNLIDATLA